MALLFAQCARLEEAVRTRPDAAGDVVLRDELGAEWLPAIRAVAACVFLRFVEKLDNLLVREVRDD